MTGWLCPWHVHGGTDAPSWELAADGAKVAYTVTKVQYTTTVKGVRNGPMQWKVEGPGARCLL